MPTVPYDFKIMCGRAGFFVTPLTPDGWAFAERELADAFRVGPKFIIRNEDFETISKAILDCGLSVERETAAKFCRPSNSASMAATE